MSLIMKKVVATIQFDMHIDYPYGNGPSND